MQNDPLGQVWRSALAWAVAGTVGLAFVGFGWAAMSMSPPDYYLSRVLYSIGFILLICSAAFSVYPLVRSLPWIRMSVIAVVILGGLVFLWYRTLSWVDQRENSYNLSRLVPVTSTEEDLMAKELAERSPKFDIRIYAVPANFHRGLKPPLKRYSLSIQDLNTTKSVAALNLKIEFHFRNTVMEVQQKHVLVPTGEGLSSNEPSVEITNGKRLESYEDEPVPSEITKKFALEIRKAIINGKSQNINFVEFYVDRWIEKALFLAEIIIDESKEPLVQKKPTQINSFSGTYSYEIRGKKFSQNINGVIP